jgi:predicted nucleotide-binding protein
MMAALPAGDYEFVVHCFAALDGPNADEAYQQIRRLWAGCEERLGITEPIPGFQGSVVLPETPEALPAGGVVVAAENPLVARQGVVRRVDDVLNLSVLLAQPSPEGLRTRSSERLTRVHAVEPPPGRMGWVDFAQMWAQVITLEANALLGETRLLLASRASAGDTTGVAATAELGQSLAPLLPYQEDRPKDWWRWGATTAAGYALWDTRPTADIDRIRDIVVIAADGRDQELSAWMWSDGLAEIPPFARYLLHAAKVRYEARLLDAWHRSSRAEENLDEVLADLSTTLASRAPYLEKAELVRFRLSRLRTEESRLAHLEADMARLSQTTAVINANLSAAAASDVGSGGMFAADQALARWLLRQIEDDLAYVRIDLARTARARVIAAEDFSQAQASDLDAVRSTDLIEQTPQSAESLTAAQAVAQADVTRRVFVVYGRDGLLAKAIRDLLRSVYLEPLEWETLVAATGSTAPYLGQVVAQAPRLAQATVVLLTPDNIVELHPDLLLDGDLPHERARAGQARANVLIELGMALMAYPDRTIVVEVGQMQPIADLAGLNVIRFDGSAVAVKKLLDRLRQAGCAVDVSGTDWLDTDRFAGLPAYQRGPDARNHQA